MSQRIFLSSTCLDLVDLRSGLKRVSEGDGVPSLGGGVSRRVAISNHRIVNFSDGKVTFRWKDYET